MFNGALVPKQKPPVNKPTPPKKEVSVKTVDSLGGYNDKYLRKENYLGEYLSNKEKLKVLLNLGLDIEDRTIQLSDNATIINYSSLENSFDRKDIFNLLNQYPKRQYTLLKDGIFYDTGVKISKDVCDFLYFENLSLHIAELKLTDDGIIFSDNFVIYK